MLQLAWRSVRPQNLTRFIILFCILPGGATASPSLTLETSGILFYATPQENPALEPDSLNDPLGPLAVPGDRWIEIRRRVGDRTRLCETCHAAERSLSNRFLPIIQGQNRFYLYRKIETFGQRHARHPFPELFASLSDQERVDFSLLYALQPSRLGQRSVRLDPGWREEIDRGWVSLAPCAACHGANGNGSDQVPDISGQNPGYLSYRIRQIADRALRQGESAGASGCRIAPVSIAQSRDMAALLTLVVDETRAERGEALYPGQCASCHDGSVAPEVLQPFGWLPRVRDGLQRFAQTLRDHEHHLELAVNPGLHTEHWQNMVHFMLLRASRSDY
jgi:cytochrome c553